MTAGLILSLVGGLLWLAGAALVVSYLGSLRVAGHWNSILTFGPAAGTVASVIWQDQRPRWMGPLPFTLAAVAWAVVATWAGESLLAGVFVSADQVRGLPGIAPPTGAWVGALVGGMLPYAAMAVLRTQRRSGRL